MNSNLSRITLRGMLVCATALTHFQVAAQDTVQGGQAEVAADGSVEGPAQGDDASPGGDIVVTGSRIPQNGNNRPIPVTVVSAENLQRTTPSSIPDALVRLPVFNQGGATPTNPGRSNGRGNGTPGSFLNLRNLGAIRTLILQDGNRVPGTLFDQTVDTNMLPQLLIQRVEVVTAGVSSVYGSDAITGVVNFITDKDFSGVKGVVQGGVSKYHDAGSLRAGIAFGTDVGDRGHFIASAEYFERDAIKNTATREFGRLYPLYVGQGTAASPFVLIFDGKQSNVAPGGLVRTGPFAGQQFLSDGSLAPFNVGTPTATNNISIGGDGGRVENLYLTNDFRTTQGFARFDYELTDSIEFYLQGRYAENRAFTISQLYTNVSNATPASPNNASGNFPLFIYSGNAFLSPAQQAALTAAGTTSFALNRINSDLFRRLGLELDLKAGAGTLGFNGNLGLGDLAWDAHYTHGRNEATYTTRNNVNAANFYAAVDAVRDPATGAIVCRATLVTPSAFPGCAPLNILGQDRASQAALDFIFEDTFWTAKNGMDDFGLNLTGTAAEGWAGPIQFALGAQYRHQTLDVTTSVPDPSFNPANLRLGPAGNSLPSSYPSNNLRYFREFQSSADGQADIYEGSVELSVPLLRDLPFVDSLSLNGAYRHARYEVSGNQTFSNTFSANTWKVGLEWAVMDGLRFRATRSRDFRAPTLWELYQTQVISGSGITDALTKTAGQVNTVAGGNPFLEPEISDNLSLGAVFQPSFLPGFSVSFDYFKIRLDNAIGGVNGLNPQVQALCLASDGSSPFCDLVERPISYNSTSPANFPTLVYNVAQNAVGTRAEGFDVEVNYAFDLGAIGNVALRGLWSHQQTLTNQPLPGTTALNSSGTIDLPRDKVNFMANYRLGRFAFDVMQRYYSAVKLTSNPTVIYADPDLPAYWQTDVNLSLDVGDGPQSATVFFNVNNLFNNTGPVYQAAGFTGSPGLRYPNLNYADVIGRYFTAGARFRF